MPSAERLGFVYSSNPPDLSMLPVWHRATGCHDNEHTPGPLTATRYIRLNWEFVTPEKWATIFCRSPQRLGGTPFSPTPATAPGNCSGLYANELHTKTQTCRQERTSRAIAADASASLASASSPPAETALVTQWFRCSSSSPSATDCNALLTALTW